MRIIVKVSTRILEAAGATILFVLTMMVFLNVVLRYGFNSGIMVTEELGRFFLVWLVFAGAILAAGADSHVRVDLFLNKLPRLPKAYVEIACDIIMIYCCWLITAGGWALTKLNVHNYMAVSGVPESWLYGSGFLCGLLIGIVLLFRLVGRIASLGKPIAESEKK
ncbi:MAG: TRAP transporter small permease [Planctomycetes bacterium]|nr:TRAP transporter small permease [Planctomycetota bacterium]